MKAFGRWIGNHRILVLIMAFVLVIPAILGMINTRTNYDILTYLPDNIMSMQGQKVMEESFGMTSQGILMFKGEVDREILSIEEKIESLEGVNDAVWIRDFVDVNIPIEMLPNDIRNGLCKDDTCLMLISFKGRSIDDDTQEAVLEIRELIGENNYLSGLAAFGRDTINLADKERVLYILLAVLFAIVILSLVLKSVFIPFIFLFGIGMAILYNMGTNYFIGEISYITKAIAAVLQLGVTTDFSIFLYHRYEEERGKYTSNVEAMAVAIQKTTGAISGAALTTMAGFLALSFMELTIGKNIGIVMAKGVLIGLISTLTILPATILIFDRLIHKYMHKPLMPSFKHLSKWVSKMPKTIIAIAFILFIVFAYGNHNKQVYYKLDESLPEDMRSRIASEIVNETYDMSTIHLAVIRKDTNPYENKQLIKELENIDGITHVLAYGGVVGNLIPREFVPDEIKDIFFSDSYQKILLTSSFEVASNEVNDQIDELIYALRKYDKDALLTGEGVLTKDLIAISDTDFRRVNVVSIAMVFLILLFTFHSISLPFMIVIAIELGVMINMGIPYYANDTIPFISSIIIGCIQLGCTVDYAILLTSRYREERNKIADKHIAIRKALEGASRSIVTSALAFFFATISVVMVSDIDMIKNITGMISRGALISMGVILLVLPSLLLVADKWIIKTSKGFSNEIKEKKNEKVCQNIG